MGILLKNGENYCSGDVFYYRTKKKIYGSVFLFRQQDYYLFAISEEIDVPAGNIRLEDVLRSPLYTLAWFSEVELLMPSRMHRIGTVAITDDYTNRAGLLIDGQEGVLLKNAGQGATWRHEFRAFALRDAFVEDVLNTRFLPKTWR